MADTQETVSFTGGAVSSRIPRYDLIPRGALKRVADRFELGLRKHGERSWNARAANQQCLEDRDFLIARAAHAIDHALKLIAKLEGLSPEDGDDDAAAIAWAGICLCAGTKMLPRLVTTPGTDRLVRSFSKRSAAWRPRDLGLWLSFFVHDLGYFGKRNIDGPERQEHVLLGGAIMRRLCGSWWEDFTVCHSRCWAKKRGRSFSRLCVADKLAFVITPLWLYLPMARATGEIKEYMRNAKDTLLKTRRLEPWEALCLQSSDEMAFPIGLRSYTRRWVESHLRRAHA